MNGHIYYFSATGNSAHVATELGRLLNISVTNITTNEQPSKVATEPLIIVCPVYSWGIPQPILEWVERLPHNDVYCAVVLTCGDDTGLSPQMMANALQKRGITINYCRSIQMPNTYVILPGFDVDPTDVELHKRQAAEATIADTAKKIEQRQTGLDVVSGSLPWLKTKIVYPLFRRYGINTRKFHYTDECVSCGRCAEVCPRTNIRLADGHPVWGEDCVSCLSCYHHCPTHAVQYGRITRNKGQYHY